MKQLIILLLLIIVSFIGFGQYQQYKRFHASTIAYKTDRKLDLEYYNQDFVINYFKAVEALNSYVTIQWTANGIDVRAPEDENTQTKIAIAKYAEKLGYIDYYEKKLERSALLKNKGLSNKEIQFLEENGINLKTYKHQQKTAKIKSLFDDKKEFSYGQTSALIFEVQKKLVANGFGIEVDGIYKIETRAAIKAFEEKNNLFADGFLDKFTLDALFQ